METKLKYYNVDVNCFNCEKDSIIRKIPFGNAITQIDLDSWRCTKCGCCGYLRIKERQEYG